MNRLFECVDAGFCEVPDGTLVNPFLNPTDPTSGLTRKRAPRTKSGG